MTCTKTIVDPDGILVQRFNEGDEGAFVEIMRRYKEKLFALAFSLLRNSADAEEVVQDTFIRAYRGLHKFRGDSLLATWLHRIAVNLSRNRYWYFFRRGSQITISLDMPMSGHDDATLGDRLASAGKNQSQEVAMNEFMEVMRLAMRTLDESQRRILVLRVERDLTYDEMAKVLGVPSGTIKSRLSRARAGLFQKISGLRPEFGYPKKMMRFLVGDGRQDRITRVA